MVSKNSTDKSHTEENSYFQKFFNKYKLIIVIILIFVMAFAVRGHLLKYDYMFEFDPYWHLRATGYEIQGEVPDSDPLGFYLQGGSSYDARPQFFWKFTAFLYALFTLGAAYDKELLMQFARWLPAIFGALISVAMYFLGKEMYNRRVGIVMGVVAATIPAFVYRTMAGFFEEDSLGFLWLVLGFIFFIRALKHLNATKNHLTYGLISAFFFALMAFTWQMFILIPIVMISYFIGNVIYMAYKNVSNKHIASFIKIFLVVFIVFSALASLSQGTGWIDKTTKYVTEYIPLSEDNIDRMNKKAIDETDVVGASVGEENTGKQFFLLKYNFSTWIPFAVIILIPLYLLFSKKKDYFALLIFFWVLVTLFMAWVKLKFTYTLGIPIAAGAGFLFYLIDEYVKDKDLLYKRAFAALFAIILIGSVIAGSHFVSTKVPPINTTPDWKDSIFWISDNTPTDAKIFNWWDYGHWITYFTERRASTDNTNSHVIADSDFAKFMVTDDLNETKRLMKKYDPDYLTADSGYFRRFGSFASYAYMTTDYSDPRITQFFGNRMGCAKGTSNGQKLYRCGENIMTEENYLDLNTTWTDKPTDVINNTPIYIYRGENINELIILNSEANNTIFAKIWFGHESVEGMFDVAYQKGNVRVYKVNMNQIN